NVSGDGFTLDSSGALKICIPLLAGQVYNLTYSFSSNASPNGSGNYMRFTGGSSAQHRIICTNGQPPFINYSDRHGDTIDFFVSNPNDSTNGVLTINYSATDYFTGFPTSATGIPSTVTGSGSFTATIVDSEAAVYLTVTNSQGISSS